MEAPALHLEEGTFRLDLAREDGALAVHLVAARIEEGAALAPGASDILAPSEAGYLARIQVERRRVGFVLGRWAAKAAVMAAVGTRAWNRIEVRRGVFDQPVLQVADAEPLAVTISHAERWAVAVCHPAGHPMGVDVEVPEAARAQVMASQMTAAEAAWAGAADASRLVGSSRVDLQACKLEYSIVSPK